MILLSHCSDLSFQYLIYALTVLLLFFQTNRTIMDCLRVFLELTITYSLWQSYRNNTALLTLATHLGQRQSPLGISVSGGTRQYI